MSNFDSRFLKNHLESGGQGFLQKAPPPSEGGGVYMRQKSDLPLISSDLRLHFEIPP